MVDWGGGGYSITNSCADPEGEQGVQMKITKLKGSFEILVRQHSMFGYHPPARETPLKWRFAGGPMMATLSGSWILSTVINFKKKVVRVGPPLTKPPETAHDQ